jgi:hypothetical protein
MSLPFAAFAVLACGCSASVITGGTSGDPDGAGRVDAGEAPPADAGQEVLAPCSRVAHIGDSLTYYTQDALPAAYATIGADAVVDAHGGRAVLEKRDDDPITGKQAAERLVADGFAGCWVIALGTNDTVYVAIGASFTRAQSIDEMMAAIDPAAAARIMWVNTFTTTTTGNYVNGNMMLWNDELVAAQARWPNLLIFDWAMVAATGVAPFSDGVHHSAEGYAARNAAIVEALAGYFPPATAAGR